MDIDRIRKINALASELLKKGLVSDWQQASVEAEKVFKNNDGSNINIYRETLKETESPASMASGSTPTSAVENSASLGDDKIKEILEQNTTYVVKVLKEFQEKIEAMEREVAVLKNRVSTVNPSVKEMTQQRGSFNDNPVPRGDSGPQPSAANHPRSGNYKDTDVSIEKFFYMGAKK